MSAAPVPEPQSVTAPRLYAQPAQYEPAALEREVRAYWEQEKIFHRSVSQRPEDNTWVFYEGPPSANGNPGIHHVMGRTIKDLFCRYQTLRGKRVPRRAGWDTHGLPVELQVEKRIRITKKDIGTAKLQVVEAPVEVPHLLTEDITNLAKDGYEVKREADGTVLLTVELYNRLCKLDVMKFKGEWDKLTRQMGYWVDLEHPYITYTNDYIESVWSLLKALYDKGLLYEDYTIQPYSPAAGTGLSSHELNLPGAYKTVKDLSAVVMFRVREWANGSTPEDLNTYILAWTTTPWTLPANSALAVGANVTYVTLETVNPYTGAPIRALLAEALVSRWFPAEGENQPLDSYNPDPKAKTPLPWRRLSTTTGAALEGTKYEPVFWFDFYDAFTGGEVKQANGSTDYSRVSTNIWQVWTGDFVTTEDGTGVVHIAPTFGADDWKLARINRIRFIEQALRVDRTSENQIIYESNESPIVMQDGKYFGEMEGFSNRYVKNYLGLESKEYDKPGNNLDIDLVIDLKSRNVLFNSTKFEHNYPHCWRTDKPILYYPLRSWFIGSSKEKSTLISSNRKINWQPESTGTGRFGNWLENLQDWNLSRSRFWGIPLPIWANDGDNFVVGSLEEAKNKLKTFNGTDKNFVSIANEKQYEDSAEVSLRRKNNIQTNPIHVNMQRGDINHPDNFIDISNVNIDLHRDTVDNFRRFEGPDSNLKVFIRIPDLIDVWFDSGAMPYAQWGLKYDELEVVRTGEQVEIYATVPDYFATPDATGQYPKTRQRIFPADFIAEGVDQTRGWFYTLHAIAGLLFGGPAFRNVIANGLVLDKDGNKMSKRLGNVVDPFATLNQYGADATRWYMVENTPPWENLKFNLADLAETQRRFFGTLWNTYQFFALYANVDGYAYGQQTPVPAAERSELDRWLLSRLESLTQEVQTALDTYEPTPAARAIQTFVDVELSNWYVRLSRRRFWKGEMAPDKQAAYDTLWEALVRIATLMSPVAPYLSDWMYRELTRSASFPGKQDSVHLADWPVVNPAAIHSLLEARMQLAQEVCSLGHSIRKKHKVKARQPLQRLLVPVLDDSQRSNLEAIAELVAAELNVKEVKAVTDSEAHIVRRIKPDFKALGPRLGADLKHVQAALNELGQAEIRQLEQAGQLELMVNGKPFTLQRAEAEILIDDIPGWAAATANGVSVALDLTLTDDLRNEGLARDLVNRLQNLRKDLGLEVTDRIRVSLKQVPEWAAALNQFQPYICAEILAEDFRIVPELAQGQALEVDGTHTQVLIERIAPR